MTTTPVRPARAWPIVVVVSLIVLALVVVLIGPFRFGVLLLAAAVVLGFFLRLLLPTRTAGLLAARSRAVDLAVLAALGVTMTTLAFWIPT